MRAWLYPYMPGVLPPRHSVPVLSESDMFGLTIVGVVLFGLVVFLTVAGIRTVLSIRDHKP